MLKDRLGHFCQALPGVTTPCSSTPNAATAGKLAVIYVTTVISPAPAANTVATVTSPVTAVTTVMTVTCPADGR